LASPAQIALSQHARVKTEHHLFSFVRTMFAQERLAQQQPSLRRHSRILAGSKLKRPVGFLQQADDSSPIARARMHFRLIEGRLQTDARRREIARHLGKAIRRALQVPSGQPRLGSPENIFREQPARLGGRFLQKVNGTFEIRLSQPCPRLVKHRIRPVGGVGVFGQEIAEVIFRQREMSILE
jgi:hypothetical protein